MTTLTAWALKRSVFARLTAHAAGIGAPVGVEALDGVQVAYVLPGEPERVCVYGTRVRLTRVRNDEEHTQFRETVPLEIWVRAMQPGEDVEAVDALVETTCAAVATSLLSSPLFSLGTLSLTAVTCDNATIAPSPEPGVTISAQMLFTAELVTL